MVLLPWSSFSDYDLSDVDDASSASSRVWGAYGNNDTGWVDVIASGANPSNQTYAYGDLFLDFAPGAEISNLTFEIAVDGSEGYCIDEPQLTLMNSQTPILDWRGNDWLGCQPDFNDNPPSLLDGELSTSLQPNSVSDASWVLPAGISISDLVIEALTPSDPRVSFSPLEVKVHGSAVNPNDGRLYVLLGDDLIHLDSSASNACQWRCPGIIQIDELVYGRSITVDAAENRLLIGTANGTIMTQSLSNSANGPQIQSENTGSMAPLVVSAITAGTDGVIWAVTGCYLGFLPPGDGTGALPSWGEVQYCSTPLGEATDIIINSGSVFISTKTNGVHAIEYNLSSNQSVIGIEGSSHWDTSNFLASNRITDLDTMGNQLLISTENAGINRRDLVTSTWLSRWSTANTLASNNVLGTSVSDGWLHVLAGNTLQSYEISAGVFRTQETMQGLGLLDNGVSISSWPSGSPRGPSNGMSVIIDSTGMMAMQHQDTPVGIEYLVSSPVTDPMKLAVSIDDSEDGQIWVAGDTTIDRFNNSGRRWMSPIDVTDYAGQQMQTVTSIIQDQDGWVWVGTSNAGILRFRNDNGAYIGSVGGLGSDSVISMAYDEYTETLVVGHPENGVSLVNTSTISLIGTYDTGDGLDSDLVVDVATRYGIAYLATPDSGLMRIDLAGLQILSSWQSLGADSLEAAPVAIDGDTVYFGLPGFGVMILDRINGDIVDLLTVGNSGLPDNDVLSLYIYGGDLVVGSRVANTGASSNGGLAIWDGSSWDQLETNIPGWNNDPWEFNDIISDGNDIYAATNRGVCVWGDMGQGTLDLIECLTTGGGSEMPSRQVNSVELIGNNSDGYPILYAGTDGGAVVVDTSELGGVDGLEIIDVWTAGDDTQRAKTVKIGQILYIGFENTGIARYDLTNEEWLTTWDGSQGYLDDDDVTVLIPGSQSGTMWAGGDFGLTLIDVTNDTVLIDWDKGTNTNGPSISSRSPAEIVIVGDVLHYSTQRSNQWWNSNDEVFRIALNNNTSLTTLDAGSQIGTSGVVYGMGVVGDELWIGVRPTQSWNDGEGTIVRWNIVNETWQDDLETIGNVQRVNAQLLGDCFPLNASSCEMWVAYGDNIMRRFQYSTMVLLDEWSDFPGPVRGMEEFNGEYVFATMEGIYRWNPVNETFEIPWTENDGLPNDTEEGFFSMEVVGDDLWVASHRQGSWNSNAQILVKNGTSGNWTSWDLGTGDIPGGYGADILVCDEIIHFAIGRLSWFGNQGGVARFDLADSDSDGITGEWIDSLTEGGNNGLSDNDPRAVACDESNKILYIGFDTTGVGIDRFNYNTGRFLSTLTSADGVSEDLIFPGGMLHDGNVLLSAHQFDNSGGISRILTSGTSVSGGQVLSPGMDGCSIVKVPANIPTYAIGRSGQTTGLNRVDRLDSTGLIASGFDELAGLSSGRVVEFASNSTHVWVASTFDSNSYFATSILQGEILQNGSVRWEYGYNLLDDDVINSMQLDGSTMWVTTAGRGLYSIDLLQRSYSPTPPALHGQMDAMILDDDDGMLYVGLMGNEGSAAGFQTFDTMTGMWGDGSLLAGLPNNIVKDFVGLGDKILTATWGGIAVFNTSLSEWEDPITTFDGLPLSIYDHLLVVNSPSLGNVILAGGPGGVTILDSNLTVLTTRGASDGLAGNSVSGLVYADSVTRQVTDENGATVTEFHDEAIFISHNGQGPTRPGLVAWDIATDAVNGTYQIDKIPSNDVRSIAADDWGVHIATDIAPLVHWNSSSLDMEVGAPTNSLMAWPPSELVSHGSNLVMISPGGIDVMDVGGSHLVKSQSGLLSEPRGAHVSDSGLYLVSNDGLHHFSPVSGLVESDTSGQRTAHPLSVIIGDRTWEGINETARPGMSTVLVDDGQPIDIAMTAESVLPGRLPMNPMAMTLSSPETGAWVWARSSVLNYSGNWDMQMINPGIQSAFQSAISQVGPGYSSAEAHIQLQSPNDGKMKVRVTYDWERVEVPTTIVNLTDRPNDGGGVLEASWLPAEDAAWNGYRIFVWDATGREEWNPSEDELDDFSTYISIPFWSQTSVMVTEADNYGTSEPLYDDRVYRIAIALEYPDGTLGDAMAWPGTATPTDEMPSPPNWLEASAISGGTAGTIVVEWSMCEELDPGFTRIWAAEQEISNAIALTGEVDIPYSSGNTTVIELAPQGVYWFAAACVDFSGQFDPTNVTLFGPVTTAGGLNDGIAPSMIMGTQAQDVPDDEGGRIEVTWDINTEDDCSFYTIYALPASGWQPPSTVDGWPVAEYVPDCSTDQVVIDSLGSSPLQDGVTYWIGVVASDDWGNENVDTVLVVEATSEIDQEGSANAPERAEGLIAWDHPEDDGSKIDIVWNRSTAPDFSFYTVWVSDYPLNDLSDLSENCDNNSASCNLIVVDQRQIGGVLQLQMTIEEAMYGNTIDSLVVSPIRPDIPLYVAVTIHDIKGNVHLTGLDDHISIVTPVDNRGDITPPDRLVPPILEERLDDDGDGMYVTFQESVASDLYEYLIFADVVPFADASNMEPVMIVDRNSELPLIIETLSDGRSLAPSIMTWVAVVPVDSSGNSWLTNLRTSSIALVDENSLDPGLHLPEVTGVRGYWDSSGSQIDITWDLSQDPQVESYRVFVSLDPFEDVRNATQVGSLTDGIVTEIVGNLLIMNELDGSSLDNTVSHWTVVVAFDGEVNRLAVDPLEILPWSESSFGSTDGEEGEEGASWIEQLMNGDMNTLIGVISALMILAGAVLFIRPRKDSAPQPWEMGALEVELEEQMMRESSGLSDDEEFGLDDIELSSDEFRTEPDSSPVSYDGLGEESFVQPIGGEYTGIQVEASNEVVDELLGIEEGDLDIDDLDDLADDLDIEGLDDLADGLDDDDDIDSSFIDEIL